MTVNELINLLDQMPEDVEVVIALADVVHRVDDVVYDTEHDVVTLLP